MKTFFSEYHYGPDRRKLKDLGFAKKCGGDVPIGYGREADAWLDEQIRKGHDLYNALAIVTAGTMLSGKGTDYFIVTAALADLIVNMVRDITPDVLDVFAENKNTAFIIHPISPRPAVLVGIRSWHGKTAAVVHERGMGGPRDSFSPEQFSDRDKQDGRDAWYGTKLAFGLALYMRFFPNAVIVGLPEIAKHPSHYRGKPCATIYMDGKLLDTSGSLGPSPHIRQAHFRFLGSEKFKAKRGSYVLVKESFVKGRSKIVLEIEDYESE